MTTTPAQFTQQYVLSIYPCLNAWTLFAQKAFVHLLDYSPTACSQVSMISQAAMKTFDYIQQNEPKACVIRVMRMMNDLYDSAWRGWTGFYAQSTRATGTRELSLQPIVLQGISSFQNWDIALNATPAFNPPDLLNNMLGGVTP
ncbi:hypothetical protein SD70_02565 [Gordoniibacillus kamchatkensis]|uniref:Uncharacterized protein n=1 Tax=Gordoniibacillus kamchatkensis TaxID=1590651 RepID=A0ABR5AM46_9BACL|nr:hypothetical protein [Paenibacillus sp. VKM B-2647]KIL42086.1 hypothetical protein SD70_02565 [Paenibacillus sp. VKM B-2647]